jgi:hypothetical protein
MLAMEQLQPDHIMTNQEQAIGNAISSKLPAFVHIKCIFHVIQLAKKHLGPLLVEVNPFADAFYACIYGTDTVEQFEICWHHMLERFGVAENTHPASMWKIRSKWAPVYFRNCFFLFTSTIGRSEGLNSYFKSLITPSDSVFMFVQQYELCKNLMLDREDNAGFLLETTVAPLCSR